MSRPLSAIPRHVRAVAAAGLAVMMIAVASGCQESNHPLPILTDPTEIVLAAANATASLHSVHAHLEITFGSAGGQQAGGQAFGGRSTIDIDANLDARSFAGRTMSTTQGEPDQTTDVILVGGQQFSRSQPGTRWIQFPNGGAAPAFPTNDELVAGVTAVVKGPGVALKLADPEPCGESTCYHVVADLEPAAAWQLIAPIVGAPAGAPPPEGLDLPPLTLHVLIDQASRALVAANTQLTFMATNVALTAGLTNQDVPVQIVAPPPGLVDQLNLNGGALGPAGGGGPAPTPQASP